MKQGFRLLLMINRRSSVINRSYWGNSLLTPLLSRLSTPTNFLFFGMKCWMNCRLSSISLGLIAFLSLEYFIGLEFFVSLRLSEPMTLTLDCFMKVLIGYSFMVFLFCSEKLDSWDLLTAMGVWKSSILSSVASSIFLAMCLFSYRSFCFNNKLDEFFSLGFILILAWESSSCSTCS